MQKYTTRNFIEILKYPNKDKESSPLSTRKTQIHEFTESPNSAKITGNYADQNACPYRFSSLAVCRIALPAYVAVSQGAEVRGAASCDV